MRAVIEKFDIFLDERGLNFNSTIIGGAALIVLKIIGRHTRDVDCLLDEIPNEIKSASVAFAKQMRKSDELDLDDDWLNCGPKDLVRDLPSGWELRLIDIYKGQSINLTTLGRIDLLKPKLFAYCDRQQDLSDCVALRPTLEELKECLSWVSKRDTNPNWPEHVKLSFIILAGRLGYEFDI